MLCSDMCGYGGAPRWDTRSDERRCGCRIGQRIVYRVYYRGSGLYVTEDAWGFRQRGRGRETYRHSSRATTYDIKQVKQNKTSERKNGDSKQADERKKRQSGLVDAGLVPTASSSSLSLRSHKGLHGHAVMGRPLMLRAARRARKKRAGATGPKLTAPTHQRGLESIDCESDVNSEHARVGVWALKFAAGLNSGLPHRASIDRNSRKVSLSRRHSIQTSLVFLIEARRPGCDARRIDLGMGATKSRRTRAAGEAPGTTALCAGPQCRGAWAARLVSTAV